MGEEQEFSNHNRFMRVVQQHLSSCSRVVVLLRWVHVGQSVNGTFISLSLLTAG